MIISLSKFGFVLTSRQAGKEAYAAYLPTLAKVQPQEELFVDFEGVSSFSPSWGDEFLTPLMEKFGPRVGLKKTANLSVAVTIEILEKQNGYNFRIVLS